ncbi:MlaD family protein [Aromatoleum sp.]|uniref:MlaD family protein n=1 Tax=Aromatoleum sp. TaxID=2307007 RepID=UPI002FCB4D78
MENRSHALAAGLFALVLGTALVFALWWFSDGRAEVREYVLESRGSVTGLNVEGDVRFRGISAGKVTDIGIDPEDPEKILVTIEIREELPITRGTRARLGYQGVTGIAYVQLDDHGDDRTPLVADGAGPSRLVLEPGLVDQLTDSTLDAAKRIKVVADQLAQFFNDENLARLETTLERLESASAGIDRTFADAPATLAVIRSALSRENLQRLSATLANLEQASGEVAPAVTEMRTLMVRLQGMADNLDAAAKVTGEGLIDNTLPQLDGLLKELTGTSHRLSRLIEEVQASPQMLLIGRTRPPPGPGEAGFDPNK